MLGKVLAKTEIKIMNSQTILVVEDNYALADTLLFALSCADYDAKAVTHFSELKLYLQNYTPSVILLDLHLTGAVPQDLVRFVKENCGSAKLVICASDTNTAEPFAHLADVVFVKPLELAKLDATLQCLLGQSQIVTKDKCKFNV
jgi:DNA-binding response OmpR family regulator